MAASIVKLTVLMPANLARLRLPKVLDKRLHHLLNEQDRTGKLTSDERKEAEALADIAATFSILKLAAQASRKWK